MGGDEEGDFHSNAPVRDDAGYLLNTDDDIQPGHPGHNGAPRNPSVPCRSLLFPCFFGVYAFAKFLSNGKQSIFIAFVFKMVGGLAEHITLFASWDCGFPTFQKTSLFFGIYFPNTLKKKT
ncbi:MAG: hypothetical protein FVQ80_13430 [Planctomycetes bacterium]|nr:hypothetical protein [Planctomycetota bacterium]